MAIKFFWMYIGVFLACSMVLVAIVKKFAEGFAGGGKKPIMYGGASSVVASLVAYATTFITDHLFTIYWIFSAVFLLFGMIHMALVHKKYFSTTAEDKSKVILGEIFFGLSIIFFTVVIFSSLQYFLQNRSYLFYPMLMSTISFFIPFLVINSFDAAYNIPAAEFKTWQYPLSTQIDLPDENPREKLYVIGFVIAKKTTDKAKTYFRAKAPENMTLGDLYYHFINDYNELQSETPIQYVGNENESQEWWFRRKPKWYQFQRILDPEITVRENGIKENTVIICERI